MSTSDTDAIIARMGEVEHAISINYRRIRPGAPNGILVGVEILPHTEALRYILC